MMLTAVLLFMTGLLFLVKGGDWFVDGAVGIAHRFQMPELLIGATVVSIGTTIPEVMVSTTSALKGSGGIAYGNAIGSIICNTALIAAISMTFRPGPIDRKSIRLPLIMFYLSAGLYIIVSYTSGFFSRPLGCMLILMFLIYLTLSVLKAKKQSEVVNNLMADETLGPEDEKKEKQAKNRTPIINEIGLLIVGAALIAVGADLLVDNGTLIAVGMGVPESVVALTMVALGTSLPELITTITSLKKGTGALALGNVIGANLFNLVLVCGVSMTLAPFQLPVGKLLMGINSSLLVDLPVMLAVMLIMTVPALWKERLYRWQGILLMIIYAAFCIYQIAI